MSVITDDEITRTHGNFEKYDPYIEKIRALFVPSLEPRIHSCLENFVYREDTDLLCNYPCLKRCLEVAATLREPVGAFCRKWGDEGFLENIISHGIRYLIKDGLIDCLINSIILNNRLNKVCRDLDALGVEREFLRSLTVWNYINERDYWIENDPTTTRSVSRHSRDFTDCQSDLDVEIGSEFRDCRNMRVPKRSSANISKNNDLLEDCDSRDRSWSHLESWLSGASSVPDESTDEKRKTISHTISCRSSNCPTYRLKNSRQSDWEGKVLKFKLSEACSPNSTNDRSKFVQLSKLHLPCQSDDVISQFNRAESTLQGLFSISRKKKFQAGVNNVCRRINEILGRIHSNEVRRCRLHCEIFPNHLNFKMTQRECNGYKVCLLTDRVLMSKIGENSRRFSSGQLPRITENEMSREPGITNSKSALLDLNDDNRQRISRTESKVSDPNYSAGLQESRNLDSSKEFTSRTHSLSHFDSNRNDNQICRCDASDLLPDQLDHGDNVESTHPTKSQTDDNHIISQEESSVPSNHHIPEDRIHICSELSPDVPHYLDYEPAKKPETDHFKTKTELGNLKGLTRKKSFLHLTVNDLENLECPCNDSVDHRFENVFEESSIPLVENTLENPECLCGLPLEKPNHYSNQEIETVINHFNDAEQLDKEVKDNSAFKDQDSSDLVLTLNSQNGKDHKNSKSLKSMLKCSPEMDGEVTKDHSDLTGSGPDVKVPDDNDQEISRGDVTCECPFNCVCEYEKEPDDKILHCDSQCSCDSCHDEDPPGALNPSIKKSSIRDDFRQMPTNTTEDRISSNPKVKPYLSENRAVTKQSRKAFQGDSGQSFIPLKSVLTKVLSRSMDEREMDLRKPHCPGESSVQYLETNGSKDKSSRRSPPILSTRLSRSKGQRINISIELCRESESSMRTIIRNNPKNIPALDGDSKKMKKFSLEESKAMSLLRESWCHSVERDNREMRVNQPTGENTKDECPAGRNSRGHSPLRPLESSDSLPTSGWLVSSVKNSIMHETPIKSSLRSNGKFDRRSMSQARGIPRDCETREFRRPIRNNRRCEQNNCSQMLSDKKEESTRSSRNSERMTSSFISGRLCHAFSSSSIDRMRHLIKTKLRRILLERDKSTNTPKTTLTNKKYRVSVPNGKTERPPFSRTCCRTIWESRSASDSTRTSRSFGSENPTGIRDREEICHLLYSSAKRSKVSSSNFETISRISDRSRNDPASIDSRRFEDPRPNKSSEVDSTDGPRLSGGSDFIGSEKIHGSEEALSPEKQRSQSPALEKKDQSRPPALEKKDQSRPPALEKKDKSTFGIQDRKHGGHSVRRNFHETFENELRLVTSDDCDSVVSRKNYRREFIACSGKFDSPLNSTSRHIYLYGIVESSNDELSGSRTSWNESCQSAKTVYSFETRKDRKSLRKRNQVPREKHRDSRLTRKVSALNGGNVSRGANRANNYFDTYSISAPHKGFSYLDYDLRSKLSEYVNLCKNVKYSLLKRLRINGVDEAGRASLICGDL